MAVLNTGEVTDIRTSILASKTLAEIPIDAFAGVSEEFIIKSREVIASRTQGRKIMDKLRAWGGQKCFHVLTTGVGIDHHGKPILTDDENNAYLWVESELRAFAGHDQQITVKLNDALGFGVKNSNIYVGGIVSDTPVNIGAGRLAFAIAYSINSLTTAVLEEDWGGA